VAALKWENIPARLARRVSAAGSHLAFTYIVILVCAGGKGRKSVTESQDEKVMDFCER
jgi:hypothetical protein